jgi:hypothetical protein
VTDWIEHVPIHDVYADGLATLENLGTNFRQMFFVWHRGPSGILERVIVAKVVRPMSSLGEHGDLMRQLAQSKPLMTAQARGH